MTTALSTRTVSRWIRNASKWPLTHLNYSISRTIGGRRLRIPMIAGIGAGNLRVREPEVEAMLSVLLDRCAGAFIDVGVNIGQTLLKIIAKDPARTYVGFEPSLLCCYYVERLISENHLENCTVLPLALAGDAQAVDLHFSKEADGGATIVRGFWSGKHTKTMRRTIWTEKGDTVIEMLRLASVGIVKIDVEGGELDVLTGLRGTLDRQSPFISVEVLPYTAIAPAAGSLAAVGIRKQRIERLVFFLREIGYASFRYRSDGVIEQTVGFNAPEYDPRMCNFLLVPKSRQPEIPSIEAAYRERLRSGA